MHLSRLVEKYTQRIDYHLLIFGDLPPSKQLNKEDLVTGPVQSAPAMQSLQDQSRRSIECRQGTQIVAIFCLPI